MPQGVEHDYRRENHSVSDLNCQTTDARKGVEHIPDSPIEMFRVSGWPKPLIAARR